MAAHAVVLFNFQELGMAEHFLVVSFLVTFGAANHSQIAWLRPGMTAAAGRRCIVFFHVAGGTGVAMQLFHFIMVKIFRGYVVTMALAAGNFCGRAEQVVVAAAAGFCGLAMFAVIKKNRAS